MVKVLYATDAAVVMNAREILKELLERSNTLGLLPEQFDPDTGEFLGNYPQGFSHIGLINSIIYLSEAEGRPVPARNEMET